MTALFLCDLGLQIMVVHLTEFSTYIANYRSISALAFHLECLQFKLKRGEGG